MDYRAIYNSFRTVQYYADEQRRKLPPRTETLIRSECLEMGADEEHIEFFIDEVERSPFVVLSLSWGAFGTIVTKEDAGNALTKLQEAIESVEQKNLYGLLTQHLSEYLPNLQKIESHRISGTGKVKELIPEPTWVTTGELLGGLRNAVQDAKADLKNASEPLSEKRLSSLATWDSVGKQQQDQKNLHMRILVSYYVHLLEETTGAKLSSTQNQGYDQIVSSIITWLRDLHQCEITLPKTYRGHIDAILNSRQV